MAVCYRRSEEVLHRAGLTSLAIVVPLLALPSLLRPDSESGDAFDLARELVAEAC
jgi:hypothetical protein